MAKTQTAAMKPAGLEEAGSAQRWRTPLQNPVLQSGMVQTIYHVGRMGEALQNGELMLGFLNEIIADEALIGEIETAVAPVDSWQTKQFTSVFDFRLYRILLYAIIRATKPKIAIETGVLHGLTSAFMLRAIERNGHGKLISIDLPSYFEDGPSNKDGYNATLPKGKDPGWTIPPRLLPHWDLRKASSYDELPKIAKTTDEIGFFCHDSDHTFPTMWFELEWGWERLVPGGVLVCDNIEASTAFNEFARRVGRDQMVFPAPDSRTHDAPRFGMLVK
jgi:hypothetical protein